MVGRVACGGRAERGRGTGMILPDVEDFVRLANAAPVAAHFGDFVLGFPAALENTQAALAAGVPPGVITIVAADREVAIAAILQHEMLPVSVH